MLKETIKQYFEKSKDDSLSYEEREEAKRLYKWLSELQERRGNPLDQNVIVEINGAEYEVIRGSEIGCESCDFEWGECEKHFKDGVKSCFEWERDLCTGTCFKRREK